MRVNAVFFEVERIAMFQDAEVGDDAHRHMHAHTLFRTHHLPGDAVHLRE